MRVNPVPALGRSNVKRKRPSLGETESERRLYERPLSQEIIEPAHATRKDSFPDDYLPNSVFMAHLIATRDAELDARHGWGMEPEFGASQYRAIAASPRKREAGHVISSDF